MYHAGRVAKRPLPLPRPERFAVAGGASVNLWLAAVRGGGCVIFPVGKIVKGLCMEAMGCCLCVVFAPCGLMRWFNSVGALWVTDCHETDALGIRVDLCAATHSERLRFSAGFTMGAVNCFHGPALLLLDKVVAVQ